MTDATLGGSHPHLYVTRAAALEYRELVGAAGFEDARRVLTVRLLHAVADPTFNGAGRYVLRAPLMDGTGFVDLRAYVVLEGRLLVVVRVARMAAA
jgi:hypothetical protein